MTLVAPTAAPQSKQVAGLIWGCGSPPGYGAKVRDGDGVRRLAGHAPHHLLRRDHLADGERGRNLHHLPRAEIDRVWLDTNRSGDTGGEDLKLGMRHEAHNHDGIGAAVYGMLQNGWRQHLGVRLEPVPALLDMAIIGKCTPRGA